MAVDQFLLLDGIQGETMDKVYSGKKGIDVLSFGWGVSNTGTFHQGSGGGAGKANFQDLTITKYIDKATAPLMLMCANGKHIAKGELIVRKAGENPLEYMKISMEKILVSSYSTGGSSGEERLTENVTLNFAKVKVEYFMQNEKGGKEPGGQMAWDIAANAQE
ncbi:MAG TPA: type VI secretion system tube protein Hcp [Nitrospiraceae bacterium]|nr:type VI secretion system tube protein Hcp [Nitrospiraceae bacterium]